MMKKKLIAKGETAKELIREINDPNRFNHAMKLYKEAMEMDMNKHKRNKNHPYNGM